MGIFDKAQQMASQNPDAVKGGLDQAEQFASEKTGGKYDDQIHQAGSAARSQFGIDDNADQTSADQSQADTQLMAEQSQMESEANDQGPEGQY